MSQNTTRILHGAPTEEGLPYSTYIRAGDYVYLSGLVAFDDDFNIVAGGVGAETHRVIAVASKLLAQAECSLSDVVKVNICLPDPADFDEFNQVYAQYFSNNAPARATICAALTIDARVEIEMTAYKP